MMQGKALCAILSHVGGSPSRAALILVGALLCLGPIDGLGAASGGGLEVLEATRARPLFSPSRRPPPPPAAPAAEPVARAPIVPPVPPPDLQLSGIVIGSQQMAIVKHPQDQSAMNVTIGSTIDGWLVSDIGPRDIVLRHDTRSVTIALPDHQH